MRGEARTIEDKELAAFAVAAGFAESVEAVSQETLNKMRAQWEVLGPKRG